MYIFRDRSHKTDQPDRALTSQDSYLSVVHMLMFGVRCEGLDVNLWNFNALLLLSKKTEIDAQLYKAVSD